MNTDVPYPIKKEQEEQLLVYINELITNRTSMNVLRKKFEICDRIVAREPAQGEKRLEVTAPIVMPQVDTMVAYLTKTFLNVAGLFPVTTIPSAQETADAVNVLFKSFANEWQWKRNLLLCFKDAAKYDLMIAECTWKEVKVGGLGSTTLSIGGVMQRQPVDKVKIGFAITHLDPYNTFWDTSVAASQLPSSGEFAGYIETKNSIQLHKFLLSLPANNGWNHRLSEIKDNGNNSNHYYKPNIVSYDAETGITNWDAHFNSLFRNSPTGQNNHEIITLYCRIIPQEFGMKVPSNGTPQIWKFIVVDMKFIVYAECKSNAHDYLPIVIGQPFESNLQYQQKTLPEELASLQDLASKLWSMEIASSRRIVANREVYNPLLIRGEDINNSSESAKIPIRNSAYNQDIRQSVYSIPYNDPAIGTRSSLAQGIAQFATMVTGQNQVSSGQFVKGNKTNAQFNEVLARSDARQVSMAVLLEDQFFSVLKHILLYDLVQYQQPMTVFDMDTKSEVKIDPSSFLDESIEFLINDSLGIGEDNIGTDTIMVAMQTMQSIPELAKQYDIAKVFAFLMAKSGVRHLESFIRDTPIQPTNEQQLQQGATQNATAIQQETMQPSGSIPSESGFNQLPPQ